MTTENPKDLEELKLWVAEHDGRINAWWREQHHRNKNLDSMLHSLTSRISAVERRMIWWAGFAAGAGGLIGGVVPKLFGG